MRYAVALTPDDNGSVLVTVPDVPEAITFGEDRDDALLRAVEAIETALMAKMEAREAIAEPKAKGLVYVDIPALSAAKIALYRAMQEQGIGKAALARRLDVALPQIDRLLNLNHHSRLDAVERALESVGRRLHIIVSAA
jgi:antitoxin HicB